MDIFKEVLGNIDKTIHFRMPPKYNISSFGTYWYMYHSHWNSFHYGIRERPPSLPLQWGIPSLTEKIPTLDSLLPILSEQAPSQNTKNALTNVAVPQQLPTST